MLALRLGRLLLKALLPNCCPTVQTLIIVVITTLKIVVITIISTCISRQRLGLGRCLEYQRLCGGWVCGNAVCQQTQPAAGSVGIDMHALDTCRQQPLFRLFFCFFFFFLCVLSPCGGTLWCCGGGYASTRQRLAPTC